MTKPSIFISYSHKDEKWRDRLVTQLRVLEGENKFEVWTDREIEAGEDWLQKIEDALQNASAAILLVSANSLTSDFIKRVEIGRFLERRAKEGLRIIPIIVRDCPWKHIEWLARIQVRPLYGRALQHMKPAQWETELKEIALEVDRILRSSSTSIQN